MRKSKKLGHVEGWENYVVYEALVPLYCSFCGKMIYPGDKFTRRMGMGFGHTTQPCCKKCLR